MDWSLNENHENIRDRVELSVFDYVPEFPA